LNIITATVIHMIFTIGFFLHNYFYQKEKTLSPKRQEELDLVFNDLNTPVISNNTNQKEVDSYQRKVLGRMVICAELVIFLLTLFAHNLEDFLIVVLSKGIMSSFGIGLL